MRSNPGIQQSKVEDIVSDTLKHAPARCQKFLKHPLSESDSAREEHFAEEDRAVEKPHFTAQTLRSRVKCQSTEATEDPALLRFKGKVKNEEVFKTEEGSCEETHQNVRIGLNTSITAEQFARVKWTDPRKATKDLLMAVFGRITLSTHCYTGRCSNAFKDRTGKPPLESEKVSDIISESSF
ncbi:hypothetical protein Q8A67_005432 [Cirrhinus molitorella]|uniref:BEN domain-containing protein n=1 Tax=Cirrhinus molitorella TaxID=172907 RepID=A0AA88PYD5_9TELE|nr:hypothetical protein Q8A67_005432 [Cirrhinus molitorella]